jgi:hypothetical protein
MAKFGFRLPKRRHRFDPHLRRATYTIEVPKHSQRVTHMLEKHLTSVFTIPDKSGSGAV